jgi:hypothetical protein
MLQDQIINFSIGCIGALAPEAFRLYNLRTQDIFKWSWSYLLYSIPFILVSGFVAWVADPSTKWAAFYTGLTTPVLLNTVLKDTAKSEKELKNIQDELNVNAGELIKIKKLNVRLLEEIKELQEKLTEKESLLQNIANKSINMNESEGGIVHTKDISPSDETILRGMPTSKPEGTIFQPRSISPSEETIFQPRPVSSSDGTVFQPVINHEKKFFISAKTVLVLILFFLSLTIVFIIYYFRINFVWFIRLAIYLIAILTFLKFISVFLLKNIYIKTFLKGI